MRWWALTGLLAACAGRPAVPDNPPVSEATTTAPAEEPPPPLMPPGEPLLIPKPVVKDRKPTLAELAALEEKATAEAAAAAAVADAKATEEEAAQAAAAEAARKREEAEAKPTDHKPTPAAKAAYDEGVAKMNAGDAAGARDAFQRAADADPAFAKPRYNMGVLAEAAGDNDRALAHYRDGLRANPRDGDSAENLARQLSRAAGGKPGPGDQRAVRARQQAPQVFGSHQCSRRQICRRQAVRSRHSRVQAGPAKGREERGRHDQSGDGLLSLGQA